MRMKKKIFILFCLLLLVVCLPLLLIKSVFNNNHKENLAKAVKLDELKNIGIGAVMPEVDFASDKIVVFHSYFGMFVYDLKEKAVVNSINLKAIDSNYLQGSTYTVVKVSKDGLKIYIDNIGDKFDKNMYVYNIKKNILIMEDYKEITNIYKPDSIYDKTNYILDGALSDTIGYLDSDRFVYVFLDKEKENMIDLEIVLVNDKTGEVQRYPIFNQTDKKSPNS